MTYEEKIEKLFARTPSFQQVGAAAYKPGLDTMVEFAALLGHPERGLRCIHIAGTNGKGSVSSFLAAALSCGAGSCAGGVTSGSGQRIGLYTSPHLTDFRERIKVVSEDGFEMIPREAVEEFLDTYDGFIEHRRPSFFEITTAMAFWYFAAAGVDLAVIECGLGGRLDSTNIINPLVSVVTNIGLEHTSYLGDTLQKIAFEKAGIIKPGRPVVIGEINYSTRPVFEQAAAERDCEIVFAPERPCGLTTDGLDLPGDYQQQNIATVATALDIIETHYGISADNSRLKRAAALTGLHGRWEKLSSKPDIICDIGHNAHGLRRVFDQLREVVHNYRHVYIIFGVVSDKDVDAIAPMMIKPDEHVSYILTQPSTKRAMPVEQLAEKLACCGITGTITSTVAEAITLAKKEAAAEDLIFTGGSNFTVSDLILSRARI
ncbi:MAG: bifunctional folylpolyglutamate synthase/dihydrofolate synthase [Bacteroidales bacterium]|nr:bifunctional folylpolyglutamate synthase/dihydrofolate synthase [Bacteroidales bacterium]